MRHAPFEGAQEEQPRSADEFEQQKPPRQAREAHVSLVEQAEPARAVDDTKAARGVADVSRPHAEEDAAPENIDGDDGGQAIGDFEPNGQ